MARSNSAFFSKISRDLKKNAARLLVLSFVLGLGGWVVTTISSSASVQLREIAREYEAMNPASAVMELDREVDEKSLAAVRSTPGVESAVRTQSIRLRVRDPRGNWQPLLVFVSETLVDSPVARVRFEKGSWPVEDKSIALERTALTTFGWNVGDELSIQTDSGQSVSMKLSTSVHVPSLAPAYQERTAYGFIDVRTAQEMGWAKLDQIAFRARSEMTTKEVRALSVQIAQTLERSGVHVTSIQVPPVHMHPHQGILTTLLLIFWIFGALTIVLGSFLAANFVESYLAKEKKTIGILKTIGVPTSAVRTLVLGPLAFVGILAAVFAVPLGFFVSPFLTNAIAALLNFSIESYAPQGWAWIVPAALTALVPILIGIPLVVQTQKWTILEALSDQGTTQSVYRNRTVKSKRSASPTLSLVSRNVFRKRRRLILNVVLMALGGGLFLTANNLTTSWKSSLTESLSARRFDEQIRLIQPPKSQDLAALEGEANVELWPSLPVAAVTSEGWPIDATYPDQAHGSFRAYGVSNDTAMLRFQVLDGRWNRSRTEVVLNQAAKARFPQARVGDRIQVSLAGSVRTFTLGGIVKELGQAAMYVTAPDWPEAETDNEIRYDVILANKKKTDRSDIEARITDWAQERSLSIESMISNSEYETGGTEHFSLLILVLLIQGFVTGGIGWIGVSSMLSLAALERQNEWGILRSIGATGNQLTAALLAEAVFVLILGFLGSVLLSVPMSAALGAFLGSISSQSALPLAFDFSSAALWLAMSLVGGVSLSYFPVRLALRRTIRENLAP